MTGLVRRISFFFGLDPRVAFAVANRFSSAGLTLATLVMITRYFSVEDQGLYYVMSSLAALQVLVELGLNTAIVQFASHEMANLSWNGNLISGQLRNKIRLKSLLKMTILWYLAGAVVLNFIVGPLGLLFFEWKTDARALNELKAPWILLVFAISCNLLLNGFLAMIEGCGEIGKVLKIRIAQTWTSGIAFVLAMTLGARFYSLAIASLSGIFLSLFLTVRSFYPTFRDLLRTKSSMQGLSWRNELWPLHWRTAVSWACGYFIFNLFSPVVLANRGAVEAGQIGMTLQILSGVNGTAIVWVSTRVPEFGRLIAANDRDTLNELFRRSFQKSIVALVFGVTTLTFLYMFASFETPILLKRLLPPELLVICVAICFLNHVVFAQASYVRAHKVEPYLLSTVCSAIFLSVSLMILVPIFGASGAIYSYFLSALIFGLGCSYLIFRRYFPKPDSDFHLKVSS